MRSISMILLGLTYVALIFPFDPNIYALIFAAATVLVVLKAIAERQPFDRRAIATLVMVVVSALVAPRVIACDPVQGAEFMVELELDGRKIEGKPLDWSKQQITMLGRDGRLWEFKPSKAKNFRKTAPFFDSYSQGEMRAQLHREYGKRFDVSGTGNYLVVHPKGQRDKWARRFEDLYRSFVQYFSARRLSPKRLEFPLVAVVFPTRAEFIRHAAKDGVRGSSVLGYYSTVSNRILMYDSTKGNEQLDWTLNAETIIHEAAHQSAFNTGIHSRHEMPPHWVAEGLGTLFEARGVWNARKFPNRSDRVNKDQLKNFRAGIAKRPKGFLPHFVSSDRYFHASPLRAYAEAWALTFFLTETRPREYGVYLAKTARGEGGRNAKQTERLKTFTDAFGKDLQMLELRYLRFIERL